MSYNSLRPKTIFPTFPLALVIALILGKLIGFISAWLVFPTITF